ncbi:aminopeptidase [Gilliamella sp. wkB108]|uniref:alpha/beta hydrolase family protein n=1 Tax=Gilliamella sp. wkB108 TaxID=3120256 RepID=UPI00080EDA0E|nr:prolyl oligopeptidase family serine peptidase [Gilliamella apicola]OCG26866.1 aminopeptidase [Gilliamella apicola]
MIRKNMYLFSHIIVMTLTLLSLPALADNSSDKIDSIIQSKVSLQKARAGFKTKIVNPKVYDEQPPIPPKDIFSLVYYPAKDGKMSAYLTPDPKDGKKHPAVIWISGGFGGQGDDFWSPAPRSNDQTGSAFRKAGLILMLPSFRGESGNPGLDEMFFGEIDDLEKARQFLASQPYVDANRIYLAGHSTGGTRVLLASELLTKFRAIFSLGGVSDIKKWWGDNDLSFFPFDTTNDKEFWLRSPGYFIESIKTPTFYFEGGKYFDKDFYALASVAKNKNIPFYANEIKGGDHFTIIYPVTELISQKIINDTGKKTNITFTQEDIKQIEESL